MRSRRGDRPAGWWFVAEALSQQERVNIVAVTSNGEASHNNYDSLSRLRFRLRLTLQPARHPTAVVGIGGAEEVSQERFLARNLRCVDRDDEAEGGEQQR